MYAIANIIRDAANITETIESLNSNDAKKILSKAALDLLQDAVKQLGTMANNNTLTAEEQSDLRYYTNRKIAVIKSLRERNVGLGLKEAKDIVEDWMFANLGFRQYTTI